MIIRASVVDQEVPLLLSRSAMEELGAIMNLGAGRVELRKLDIEMELKRTPGGLCGFRHRLPRRRVRGGLAVAGYCRSGRRDFLFAELPRTVAIQDLWGSARV